MLLKRHWIYCALALSLAGSISVTGCSAKAQSADSKIELTQFEVTHPDKNTTKLVIAAKGSGIAVGSYFIRLDNFPQGAKIDGIYKREGFNYINGGTTDKPSPNLLDNGKCDEDPRPGVFAYTFHTQNWPDGRYMFLAGAQNRPASGAYMAAPHGFVITKGKVAPLQISNIPPAVHRVIYQKDGVYSVFPDLFILPDGKIGTTFLAKAVRSHIIAGGSVSLTSSDGGKTWENAKEPIVDQRWKTKDGKLVIAEAQGWVYVDASKEAELNKQHKVIMNAQAGTIAYLGGAQFRTSSDGGKTWRTQEIALPKNCLGVMTYHSYAAYLLTSKGIRLRAVYGHRLKPDAPDMQGPDEVYLLRSADDGKSWECFPMYPGGPPDPKLGFNETTIAEAANGTLIALMRSNPEGYLWQADSKDGGLTWSRPVQTPMWGTPADLIRLKDGRLLCVHGYRRAPMGIRAEISRDNGKTWDVDHELILRQDGFGSPSDLGYPLAYELPDGSIFCIYYITTDGQNTQIASTTFKLPEP